MYFHSRFVFKQSTNNRSLFRMKIFSLFALVGSALGAAQECEVCNTFLGKVEKALKDEGITGNDEIEKKVRAMCKEAKDQDNRFCYYTGLTADAATTMHKVSLHFDLVFSPFLGRCQPTRIPQARRQNLRQAGQKGLTDLRVEVP